LRTIVPIELEMGRIRNGPFGTVTGVMYGAFTIGVIGLRVISSGPEQWEHVSVSLDHRCPTWDEMCMIKDLFWTEQEDIIQFHPRASAYINCHRYCLHMWKPPYEVKLPPSLLIAPTVRIT